MDNDNELRGDVENNCRGEATTPRGTTEEPGILDPTSRVHLQPSGSGVKRKRGLGEVRGFLTDARQVMDPEFRSVAQDIISRCFKAGQRIIGRYRSDIFECQSEAEIDRVCKTIREYGHALYKRGFSLLCKHDSHIHVVHDCVYPGNGSCRCAFIAKAKTIPGVRFRGSVLRPTLFSELSLSDWEHILFYFTETRRGRRLYEVRIHGRVEKIPASIETVQDERVEGGTKEGALEICGSLDGPEFRRELEITSIGQKGIRGRSSINQGKRARRKTIQQKILDFMQDHPCSPIVNIINHPDWLSDPDLKFMRADNKIVKDVIDMFMAQLCIWNFHDFNSLYKRSECVPTFAAGFTDNNEYYYNINDSINILIKLLEHQFSNDYDRIQEFMENLYKVLEKKIPKTNCILVCSPPSAGKNFFFDTFIDYLLNKGQLGTANKNNQFAFQDAFTKRIILWNEPNFETSMIDTIKMMTAGDAYNVNVKHKSNCGVFKTPILILTNNKLSIMQDPSFKDRIIQYNWIPAPFLKECTKKPSPLAAFELFKFFNIIDDNVKVK
nr:NS1 [Mute swan feces associated ambidensovirus 7]